MLSIVYCTREHNQKVYNHISDTCGVSKVEIIEYINKGVGLPKAYNEYLKKAKYDNILFVHDDVIFNEKGWGKKLLRHLNNSDYGILGLAGTTHVDESGIWYNDRTKMIGIVNHLINGKIVKSKYSKNFGKEIIEAVLVDGLFIAVNRNRIINNFNEKFKWHYYDVDFSLNNKINNVKIGVIFDINVTHKSPGEVDEEWFKSKDLFLSYFKEKLPISITPKIRYKTPKIKLKKEPKISIIIPSKDNFKMLSNCIDSIFNISNYNNYEIIIADTGSNQDMLSEFESKYLNNSKIKIIKYDYYNFAKINNDVVKNHVGDDTELLLFMNDDIKLINDVISIMVNDYIKNKNSVGTIGCRLHYENGEVQHSGMILVLFNNTLNITHYGLKSYYTYYDYKGDILGNTGALMMTPKKLFNDIGGFNEDYIECFEDVEYNIKCILKNKKNIFNGNAVAYHYESVTRGLNKDKNKRLLIDWNERLFPLIRNNKVIHRYINKF